MTRSSKKSSPPTLCISLQTILLICTVIIIIALCVYICTVLWLRTSPDAAPGVARRRIGRTRYPASIARISTSESENETGGTGVVVDDGGDDTDEVTQSVAAQSRLPTHITTTTNIIHTPNPPSETRMLQPPLRSSPDSVRVGRMPINVETRGTTPEIQQVGILSNGKNDTVLALYGRPTYRGSSKWMYYTGSDKFHTIRLPIMKQQRDCTSEYGCDELYDNDEVTVTGYDTAFKVTIYGLDAPRYIPFVV